MAELMVFSWVSLSAGIILLDTYGGFQRTKYVLPDVSELRAA